MRVLFVQPKLNEAVYSLLEGGTRISPGLLYVATSTQSKGHEVKLVMINEHKIEKIINKFSPEVVAVGCLTSNYPVAVKIINKVKKINPRIITVMGGQHVTFLPKKAFKDCNVDFIIRGEAEFSFPSLLECIENKKNINKVPGICFKKRSRININKSTLNPDLDSLPFPSTDLIPKGAVYIPFVYNSRGCPFKCSYCAIPAFYQERYRLRKVENIINEIEYLRDSGYKKFHFQDDNFTFNVKRVETICKSIMNRGIDIKWSCQSRLDIVAKNPNLVDLMADAGCNLMSLGI
jgi:radical SAM superfamily enzyme YgiQ (UPF0313 family)